MPTLRAIRVISANWSSVCDRQPFPRFFANLGFKRQEELPAMVLQDFDHGTWRANALLVEDIAFAREGAPEATRFHSTSFVVCHDMLSLLGFSATRHDWWVYRTMG